MRLSREEFWLLDIMAQNNGRLALSSFDRSDADLLFNKRRHHGLVTDDLAHLVHFIQEQGDLTIFQRKEGMFPEFEAERNLPKRAPEVRVVIDYSSVWQNPVFFTKKEILADFQEAAELRRKEGGRLCREPMVFIETRLYCCATVQGAEKWEETAQVDWNKFHDASGTWITDADLAPYQSLMLWRTGAVLRQTLDAWFDWKIRWDASSRHVRVLQLQAIPRRSHRSVESDVLEDLSRRFRMRLSGILRSSKRRNGQAGKRTVRRFFRKLLGGKQCSVRLE